MAKIYFCHIIPHDFFFLTRIGFVDTKMPDYIGNYGLMYALNRLIPSTQRIVSWTKPHYAEDTPVFKIYATPAEISKQNKVYRADGSSFNWRSSGRVMITYNSINTLSNTSSYDRSDPRAKMNFPMVGRKEKDQPLTCYQFYAIGEKPQQLIRLGKKMTATRVVSELLIIQKSANGNFEPTHPVNPSDTSAKVLEGTLYPQFPPLLLNVKMTGEYCLCLDSHGNKHIIALPKNDFYTGVDFQNGIGNRN
jgi:CRISPR type I-D-associated protein Csc1